MSGFQYLIGQPCECGRCVEYAKPGRRFVSGHNLRTIGNPMQDPQIAAKRSGENHHMKRPEVAKKCSNWMKRNNPSQKAAGKGHWNRGRIRPEITGDKNPAKRPEVIAKRSGKNHYLYGVTGKNHPHYGKKRFDQKQRMLDGQAAYMLSFVRNPSIPQVELFKLIKQLYPTAILNYPSLNRSIDIAIPDLMIAIEYDGSYWHQDRDADEKRQKELEAVGWGFLRYCDCVPPMKELKRDLQRIGE